MQEISDPITEPRRCPEAFIEQDDSSLLSQAALLLSLAPLLHREGAAEELISPERRGQFPLPNLPHHPWRIDGDEADAIAPRRFDFQPTVVGQDPSYLSDVMYRVAERLYSGDAEPIDAVILARLAGRHPSPLVAVAGLVAQADMLVQAERPVEELRRFSDIAAGTLAGNLAMCALARMPRENQPIVAVRDRPPMDALRIDEPADALVLIHGTTMPWFAGGGISQSWWRPGEVFHDYLRMGSRPDVYAGPDPFAWGGGLNDEARDVAAKELRRWLDDRGIRNPDFVTHSHGGNVLLHAIAAYGVVARRMVLASCPVRSNYPLRSDRIGVGASIRIEMDLFLLAEGSGQRFNNPAMMDHVLGRWFVNHSDPLLPEIWQSHGFDALLR